MKILPEICPNTPAPVDEVTILAAVTAAVAAGLPAAHCTAVPDRASRAPRRLRHAYADMSPLLILSVDASSDLQTWVTHLGGYTAVVVAEDEHEIFRTVRGHAIWQGWDVTVMCADLIAAQIPWHLPVSSTSLRRAQLGLI